jgi:hypothetical protein
MAACLSGVSGMVAGAFLAPSSIFVGNLIGDAASRIRECRPEHTQLIRGMGSIVGTSLLLASLDASAFTTGIKLVSIVASVVFSSFSGIFSGIALEKKRDIQFVQFFREYAGSERTREESTKGQNCFTIGVISGLVVSIFAALAIHSVVGCCLGSMTALFVSSQLYSIQNPNDITWNRMFTLFS